MWNPDRKEILKYSAEIQRLMYGVAKRLVLSEIGPLKMHIHEIRAFGEIMRADMTIYSNQYTGFNSEGKTDYKCRYGADVDIFLWVDDAFVAPRNWKFIKGHNDEFDEYEVGALEDYIPWGKHLVREGRLSDLFKVRPVHPIKFLVYNERKHPKIARQGGINWVGNPKDYDLQDKDKGMVEVWYRR